MSVVLLVYTKQCYAAGRSADITKGADKHLTLDLGYVTPKALNSVPPGNSKWFLRVERQKDTAEASSAGCKISL